MVIAVVTHPADAASVALARRWHAHDARLLTSADLSSPGWLVSDQDEGAAMAVVLTWWLTGLPVPVINRPTALSLAGPGWRPATWHTVAQRAGLRSAAPRWRAERQRDHYAGAGSSRHPPPDSMRIEVVTVVG